LDQETVTSDALFHFLRDLVLTFREEMGAALDPPSFLFGNLRSVLQGVVIIIGFWCQFLTLLLRYIIIGIIFS
jgi:hypothetical protein